MLEQRFYERDKKKKQKKKKEKKREVCHRKCPLESTLEMAKGKKVSKGGKKKKEKGQKER